jgi:tRNA(Met) cytidine acetyltransferase
LDTGQQLRELQQQYQQRRWRLPLWLQVDVSADPNRLPQTLTELLASQAESAGFWLGEWIADLPLPAPTTQIKHKGQLLGVEADWIVINGLAGIDWDLLAASSGCLRAGGLWLLITTTPQQFAQQPNPLAQRLLSYPLQAHEQVSNFQQFWLSQQQDWWLYNTALGLHRQRHDQAAAATDPSDPEPAVDAGRSFDTEFSVDRESVHSPFSTHEQQQAVAAILKVVSGHRRRPLLLTAHRGRGKSAALGLAAAQLQQLGKQKLIITAPNPAAAAVALQHAKTYLAELLPDEPLALQFWPIDLLLQQQPTTDLVMVDEAAAIPLPQLQQLTQLYSRLVFATTEHGYEGTGRSFSLKFQPYLQQHCPGWRQLQLQTPVRYASDDPLERQIFRSFLLACAQPTPTFDPALPLHTKLHPAAALLTQPTLLASIFGLLSLAHYQTEVTDLWAILDNPQLQVMALYQQSDHKPELTPTQPQLLGCAVMSFEGQLPSQLATQVYQGERRVQGHLLAQSLAFHLAAPELAEQSLARVQRIVIHPAWQSAGLGQYLLNEVQQHCQQQGVAAVGSSFGATPALLRFWTRQGFLPIKLSTQAEQASGEPSVLMLKSCDNPQQKALEQLHQQFATQLYLQLADSQRKLKPALALSLCQPPEAKAATIGSDTSTLQQLMLFAAGKRPYELVELLLLDWFNQHARTLPDDIAVLLVQKLWQKHSWAELAKQHAGLGKPQLIAQIRQAVATFLSELA